MNATWVVYLFVLLKISQSESLTLQLSTSGGSRRSFSGSVLQRASIPATTIPVARQTLSTSGNIPGISTDVNVGTVYSGTPTTVGTGTVFSGTPTTVGTAGIDVLRRGTELIADRIASALGGVAVLVDILRNTSVNGDVVWANLGSTSQALATRLLTVGMNTANTLLQELNGQLTVTTNPTNVLQTFFNIPSVDQLATFGGAGTVGSLSRSTPVSSQIFFPNGGATVARQSSGASGSIPTIGEIWNNISGNLGGALPSVSTISTSRPGLNIASVGDRVAENVSSIANGALPGLNTNLTSGQGLNMGSMGTQVAENVSSVANGALPGVNTDLTSGQGLNMASVGTQVAENVSSAANGALASVNTNLTGQPGSNVSSTDNPVAQDVNSEVETFFDNLDSGENFDVSP